MAAEKGEGSRASVTDSSRISLNVLIGGEAGQGLATIGEILAESLVKAGFMICVTQSYQSRIRGGHNTFSVRAGIDPVEAPEERYDLIVALNGETVDVDGEKLGPAGLIIVDEAMDLAGRECAGSGCVRVPFEEFGPKSYLNTAAAGVVGYLAGLNEQLVGDVLLHAFGKKDDRVVSENREVLGRAYIWCGKALAGQGRRLAPPPASGEGRVMMHGNEAIARGALSAGLGFYAYYPMTPSTSIAMGLIDLKQQSGDGPIVEQAEDEIAAVNMALGASFVGKPAMVGTSGGGFALMVEGVSLAAMTETPVVIAVAQRPGPATGLPTRTEQGDLEMVLYAGHGEFPRAVFAPGSVEECFHVTRHAFAVAERVQGPTFILTDQFMADSYRSVEPLEPQAFPPLVPAPAAYDGGSPYRRYALSPSGVSPRLFPGAAGHLVVADSDEHSEDGHITEDLEVRKRMVEKRLGKERVIRDHILPPTYDGPERPELLFVCWGSSKGAVAEAGAVLRGQGVAAAVLHFSQVWPLPDYVEKYLYAAGRVVCVEGNATGQFARIVQRETGYAIAERIGRYDGLPFTADYVLGDLGKRAEP